MDPESVVLTDDKPSEVISPIRRKKSIYAWMFLARDDEKASLQNAIIKAIENFCGKSEAAASICEQILINYIISVVLDCSYDEVANEQSIFKLLKRVLSSEYKERYSLAKSLIEVNELSDESVTRFLSQEIYFSIRMIPESITMLPESKLTLADMNSEILYNPSSTEESFQLTVKLCRDPSILGKKLMELAALAFEDFELSTANNSAVQAVELLICANNCFLAACNVEGIAQVLHRSKILARVITKADKFQLLVRLFIGIGRYSEMSYVFDMLMDNGKFELLLGEKMKKVPNLRLSLLDYLKRCPEAEQYYGPLLQTFGMFRQIAEDAERSARARLTQLCKMETDVGIQKKLESIIKELTHAAENYMQVECVNQAMLCAKYARLVALQIHLHPEWIIGLNDVGVKECIIRLEKFSYAVVVAEHYKHNDSWGKAIFNNVIIRENRSYLRDLNAYLNMTESMIKDVVKSYQSLSSRTESQAKNMKYVLSFCSDVKLRYQLANQLEFNDLKTELLMGESGAYLHDCLKISDD